MEPDDENAVQPTRSLFGGSSNPFASDAEASGLDVNAESDITEQSLETEQPLDAEPIIEEPAVPQAVFNEPEPESGETEEAQPIVEEPVEATVPVTEIVEPVEEEVSVAEAPVPVDNPISEIEKLKTEREKLDNAIAEKQLAKRKSVISQIAAVIKLWDIPLPELVKALGGVPNPRKGEKAPILFKDASGNTWTGRGKTPRWLKDKNPEDYRV